MEKLGCGVANLDKLLGGGFERGKAVLLLAPAGSGKTTLAYNFAVNSLKGNLRILFISTNTLYEECAENLKKAGAKIDPKKCTFIDCASWRQPGETTTSPEGVVVMESISNMNEFMREVGNSIKRMGGVDAIILDSLSDFLLYSTPSSVFKTAQMLHGKLTKENAAGLFLLEVGLHEEDMVNTLNYICDGKLEMRTKEGERELRIARMAGLKHSMEWISYTIDENQNIII